ncbi:MAG: hypothetical protein AAGA03_17605, partial [Planctomycetota bacterium]
MRDSTSPIYIFGGASTALEIREACLARCPGKGESVFLVVPEEESPDGEKRIAFDLLHVHLKGRTEGRFILSMTQPAVRRHCLDRANQLELRPTSVIHPSAWVSPTAVL